MTDEEYIQQAKNYALAIGSDPDRIKTVKDADKIMESIADDCKKYGCD